MGFFKKKTAGVQGAALHSHLQRRKFASNPCRCGITAVQPRPARGRQQLFLAKGRCSVRASAERADSCSRYTAHPSSIYPDPLRVSFNLVMTYGYASPPWTTSQTSVWLA
jgi:hypothetical protein